MVSWLTPRPPAREWPAAVVVTGSAHFLVSFILPSPILLSFILPSPILLSPILLSPILLSPILSLLVELVGPHAGIATARPIRSATIPRAFNARLICESSVMRLKRRHRSADAERRLRRRNTFL